MFNSDRNGQELFSKEHIQDILKVKHQFETAIRPEGFTGALTDKLPDLPVSYHTIFLSWLRRAPRYHPSFKAKQASIDDAAYTGIDPSPATAKDPSKLRLTSQYVWAHRYEAPNPEALKLWLEGTIDINGKPKPGQAQTLNASVFETYADWYRWQNFVLEHTKTKRDNFALVDAILQAHKSGWNLPQIILNNCQYFLTVTDAAPDLRSVYAVDYIDFAKPQIKETEIPEINLKKSVKHKKISKRQLAELEQVVAYLLPPSLRVGLTGKLIPAQLEYLAKAAKWLRPKGHSVWKKPWEDGLGLLALMVMDKTNPMRLAEVKPLAREIETRIDELPDPAKLTPHVHTPDLEVATKDHDNDPALNEKARFMRMMFDPAVKTLPGSNLPKDLVLTQMGILRPDGVDEARLKLFSEIADATYTRRNDPNFWLMAHLDITMMLMKDMIDLDGNILAEALEVKPFLRNELRDGPPRRLFNDIAGLWLYPNQRKTLPDTLTKTEAETLQTICHWLDPKPRRPRPFFWKLQDMVMTEIRNRQPLKRDRMRELAQYIHAHIDEPPDHDRLTEV